MRGKYNGLLSHFNARRELCEYCAHELAEYHLTYPLDLMLGSKCFFDYQRDLPAGSELEVTRILLIEGPNNSTQKEK
jgi:hypothetical protein